MWGPRGSQGSWGLPCGSPEPHQESKDGSTASVVPPQPRRLQPQAGLVIPSVFSCPGPPTRRAPASRPGSVLIKTTPPSAFHTPSTPAQSAFSWRLLPVSAVHVAFSPCQGLEDALGPLLLAFAVRDGRRDVHGEGRAACLTSLGEDLKGWDSFSVLPSRINSFFQGSCLQPPGAAWFPSLPVDPLTSPFIEHYLISGPVLH